MTATRHALTVLLAGLALLAAGACQEQAGPLRSGIASFRVTLLQPIGLGTQREPLQDDGPHVVIFDVEALGVDGQILADYDGEVPLWLGFEGSFARLPDATGKTTVTLTGGAARNQERTIPFAYGPTSIVVEDAIRDDSFSTQCLGPYPPLGDRPESCSYAVGSSATIYYRNPYLDEIQEPLDRTVPAATHRSKLQGKSVYVDRPRDVDSWLVVTGAYAQAFTVTDMSASAMARGFNHVYVFSFSRAKRNDYTAVAAGDIVIECPDGVCDGYLSGGLKEFVGFTELDFPVYDIWPPTADASECRCGLSYRPDGSLCETKTWFPCPEPVLLDPAWINGLVTEGDAARDLNGWSAAPMTDANSTDGVVYGTWLQSGTSYVLTLYRDAARSEQVGQGMYESGGAPTWPQTISFAGTYFGSVVARGFSGDNLALELHDDPNSIKLESLEAALVRIEDARVCTYDEKDWTKYGQITVDFGSGCNLAVAFKDAVPTFDPIAAPGQTVAGVIGTLRNLSDYSSSDPTASYSYWILSPRTAEDVDCGAATACAP